MKKVIILASILLILSLQAMEEDKSKVLSLKEQAAKVLATRQFKGYREIPDSTTRELVFKYRNPQKLNSDEFEDFFAVEEDISQSFAHYLAPLIQEAVFEKDLGKIVEIINRQNDSVKNNLQRAFVDLYKKNNEEFTTIVNYYYRESRKSIVGIPLDYFMFYKNHSTIPSRKNLPIEILLFLVWIQQIEKELEKVTKNYKSVSVHPMDEKLQSAIVSLDDMVLHAFTIKSNAYYDEVYKELGKKLDSLADFIKLDELVYQHKDPQYGVAQGKLPEYWLK